MAVTLYPQTARTFKHILALQVIKKHEKMKTDCPSETLTSIYQVTRRHLPKKKPLTATDDRNAKTWQANHVTTMRAYSVWNGCAIFKCPAPTCKKKLRKKKLRHNIWNGIALIKIQNTVSSGYKSDTSTWATGFRPVSVTFLRGYQTKVHCSYLKFHRLIHKGPLTVFDK